VDDNRFSTSAFCHDLLHPITLRDAGIAIDEVLAGAIIGSWLEIVETTVTRYGAAPL